MSTSTSSSIDTQASTPLWVFLYLYCKAEYECYIEYMRGAKALYKFLAPIEFPNYPKNIKLPYVLHGYEVQELTKIVYETFKPGLNITHEEHMELRTYIQDTIALCFIKEVIPKLLAEQGIPL